MAGDERERRPYDVRDEWEKPTFRELDTKLNERDARYEQRFRSIEKLVGHEFIGLVFVGVLAIALLALVLVVFASGSVK